MAKQRTDATGPSAATVRHFTATGFLTWQGRVLLHWHRRNHLWLPFGGHVEENEDPVQCVLREVEEETGIKTAIFGASAPYSFAEPPQLAPPVTILLERVSDGTEIHEHIDMIYFCRPLSPPTQGFNDPTVRWLDAAALAANNPMAPAPELPPAAVPEDVRVLALEALRLSSL
jgi:8-oxo-dGTP diphosphatase